MTAISEGSRIFRDRHSPLIASAAEGNPQALAALLKSARPIVYGWAAMRTPDHDDAEDVTQMVLLKLYSRLPAFRGESRLSSWLFRVTINEIACFTRKRTREQNQATAWREAEIQERTTTSDPDRIDRQRVAVAVRKAASSLPPLQQSAFRLVDLDGLRPFEVARRLGKTETNIRSSLCRARKKIGELVRTARAELIEDLAFGS